MAITNIDNHHFVDVNTAFSMVIGYRTDEIIGKTSRDLGLFADPDERKKVWKILENYGQIVKMELKVKTREDDIRECLFWGKVVESQNGDYFLKVLLDITEQKELEAKQKKIIQKLRSSIEKNRVFKEKVLPICSHCKKIRNTKGQWEQIDTYITNHTGILFSHSICPDCLRKLYPEL